MAFYYKVSVANSQTCDLAHQVSRARAAGVWYNPTMAAKTPGLLCKQQECGKVVFVLDLLHVIANCAAEDRACAEELGRKLMDRMLVLVLS